MDDIGIDVFVGIDMAKEDHFAQAITVNGDELFARSLANDEADINAMIDTASQAGQVALVIDMTSSVAQLL